MSGGGGEKANYDGVSLRGPVCCHDTAGCTGVGEKHWCERPEAIKLRQTSDDKYTESLRKAVEDATASADHRALVNADLVRKLEAYKKREESLELALICAQDIVDGWPTLTFRTIGGMTKKV